MDHVAIMNPRWKLIPKILSGEKTIESRWYVTRRAPWHGIAKGDRVFFKDSGKPVTLQANVAEALFFELKSLQDAKRIVRSYGKAICLVNKDPNTWSNVPRYCILIRLESPSTIERPFHINKVGFGVGAAWISVQAVDAIRL